ncbi:DUF1127 domain-containing protein [Rhizobium phaseoli]|uniref:DUF1127 domain-containing protein n=2 Tax=Rhizobium phaseoli TaxID=396 RepID=UPI0014384757|nr:DUF1127 domain-containing protein [Rhizobium phaseoli]
MAATKHSEAELQLLHLSIVGTLQAVRMLLKHQRRCRRSLSELSRFDSRLLRDIGLEPPTDLQKDRRAASNSHHKLNWQHFYRITAFNCD